MTYDLLQARRLIAAASVQQRRAMSNVHPGYKQFKEVQKQWAVSDSFCLLCSRIHSSRLEVESEGHEPCTVR